MGGGGGYFQVNFGHLKSEVFQFGGGGFLENLDKNLLFEECVQKPACASQIVSHVLRMWRLMSKRREKKTGAKIQLETFKRQKYIKRYCSLQHFLSLLDHS